MLKIKPEFWTREGGKRYVLLSLADFEKVKAMVEDAGLARILRDARRSEANEPTVSLAEVKRRLGFAPRRARKTR